MASPVAPVLNLQRTEDISLEGFKTFRDYKHRQRNIICLVTFSHDTKTIVGYHEGKLLYK